MLKIDTETMTIAITRGDTASITFAAKKGDGTDWNPQYTTDTLTLAVAKKWGGDPLMEIANTYDGTGTEQSYVDYWTITINTDDWLNDDGTDKFKFADYVFDVQVGTSTGNITIIGKTDDISPTFRVLGEVAPE